MLLLGHSKENRKMQVGALQCPPNESGWTLDNSIYQPYFQWKYVYFSTVFSIFICVFHNSISGQTDTSIRSSASASSIRFLKSISLHFSTVFLAQYQWQHQYQLARPKIGAMQDQETPQLAKAHQDSRGVGDKVIGHQKMVSLAAAHALLQQTKT